MFKKLFEYLYILFEYFLSRFKLFFFTHYFYICDVKKAVSILLIMLVIAQCSIKLGIVAYYQINKGYITANFCINKAKPKLQCNGKCYLAKKLKKAQENEEKQASLLNSFEQNVYMEPLRLITFQPSNVIKETNIPQSKYLESKIGTPYFSIIQPPKLNV